MIGKLLHGEQETLLDPPLGLAVGISVRCLMSLRVDFPICESQGFMLNSGSQLPLSRGELQGYSDTRVLSRTNGLCEKKGIHSYHIHITIF